MIKLQIYCIFLEYSCGKGNVHMTDRELRKLGRTDLLEMLLIQKKENDRLRQRLAELEEKLRERQIAVDQAGSIAEASLQLNGVFASAQAACGQYMENIEQLSVRQEEVCRRMEQETREKCDRMLREAREQSQAYWDEYMDRVGQFLKKYEGLRRELKSRGERP